MQLTTAQDKFVSEWGRLSSNWGVNKAMGQIHAILLISNAPMNSDEIMANLEMSRGNVNMNIKSLIHWGLIKKGSQKGCRKDYYTAEKEPWKLLCTVARERKRREIEPAIDALDECLSEVSSLKSKEAKAFKQQLTELQEFLQMADRVFSRLGKAERSSVLKWLTKLI